MCGELALPVYPREGEGRANAEVLGEGEGRVDAEVRRSGGRERGGWMLW